MKAILAYAAGAAMILIAAGCAGKEQRHQTVREVGQKLEAGARGQGEIVSPDRSDDPFIR